MSGYHFDPLKKNGESSHHAELALPHKLLPKRTEASRKKETLSMSKRAEVTERFFSQNDLLRCAVVGTVVFKHLHAFRSS